MILNAQDFLSDEVAEHGRVKQPYNNAGNDLEDPGDGTITSGNNLPFWIGTLIQPIAFTRLKEDLNTDTLIIGGGIAGDFPICVVPMMYQDLEWHDVPFWSYFCQISDSTTSYGSYSGAVPNEKITWGKLDIHTPKFIIESDATIVAPLVFAYILNQ